MTIKYTIKLLDNTQNEWVTFQLNRYSPYTREIVKVVEEHIFAGSNCDWMRTRSVVSIKTVEKNLGDFKFEVIEEPVVRKASMREVVR